MAKATQDKTVATQTLDPVATPTRVPTKEGFTLKVVMGGADTLTLTFNTQALRDQAADGIQSSVKRGAMQKGFKIRAREGTFLFCNVLYVLIEDYVNPREA